MAEMASVPWHLYLMALLYMLAGTMHFTKPRIYLAIMPPYLPFPRFLVSLSGLTEIVLGAALCVEPMRKFAVYAIVLMLTCFLLVHVHMLRDEKASLGLPKWVLLLRIPMQLLLIYWALAYV